MSELDSIRTHFERQSWKARFEDEVLLVGHKLKGRVRELHSHWEAGDQFTLHGVVDGAHCEVIHWPEGTRWDFESQCDCEVHSFCPHAVAVLLATTKPHKLADLLEAAAPASTIAPTPPTDRAAPASSLVAGDPGRPVGQPLPELRPSFHLRVTREPTEGRIVKLLLQALKLPDHGDWVVARASAVYGDEPLPLGGRPGLREHPLRHGELVLRDPAAEGEAIRQLQQAGLESIGSQPHFRFLLGIRDPAARADRDPKSIWFANPTVGASGRFWPWFRGSGREQLEQQGWSVEFDAGVGHELIETDPGTFRYQLEDGGGGWFHLSVGFDVGKERIDLLPILAELLERGFDGQDGRGDPEGDLDGLARGGEILHYLDDGRALRLPAARIRAVLRQFAALLDPRRFEGGKLQLHPLDAAALATALPDDLTPPKSLDQLVGSLSRPLPRSALATPAGLQAELRDYQRDGFHWLRFLAHHGLHGILADDMGLGKTLQTLTHILAEQEAGRLDGRPALVVAPTSVVPNWRAEAKRFAPALRVLVLEGPRRRRDFPSIPHAHLVITSFALLQRDIEHLRKFQYHLAILDEAQYIKNPAAKVSQAACRLEARHRLCLSGTPVENHLGELWSLMRFLMPGFLGGQEDFGRRFRRPIEAGDDEDRREALRRRVAPLILRRTKDEVAKELPPKTILVHPVELNTAQKDLYETVRATMDKRVRQSIAARGIEGTHMLFLEALLKLRQICCEPRLLKLAPGSGTDTAAAGSAKLDYLAGLVDTLVEEGRRILLFSQFTTMLDLIAAHLDQRRIPYLMLTGSSKDRGALVERFQTGEVPLFLISLKAGGTGLNLTAADTVIHYDPWWNPAAEAQATDRAYRIGQKNPVFVHKLICQGTVEERIHQLQLKKAELAETLLAGSARRVPDAAMLQALLAP